MNGVQKNLLIVIIVSVRSGHCTRRTPSAARALADLNHGQKKVTASNRMRTNTLALGVACWVDMMFFYMEGENEYRAL